MIVTSWSRKVSRTSSCIFQNFMIDHLQQLADANDQLSRQLADLNAKATQLQSHIEKLSGVLQQH